MATFMITGYDNAKCIVPASDLKPNQAGKGVRFKLWMASGRKQDFRTADITQTEAETLLAQMNAENGYQPKAAAKTITTATKSAPTAKTKAGRKLNPLEESARQHIVENIPTLVHSICEEVDIVSIVHNDTNFVPDDGKRFKMFGGGCGFAWITGYRKTDKNKALAEIIGKMHKQADEMVAAALPKNIRKTLEDNGSLWPLLAQSLAYNCAWAWVQVSWLEKQKVKGCRVESRYD